MDLPRITLFLALAVASNHLAYAEICRCGGPQNFCEASIDGSDNSYIVDATIAYRNYIEGYVLIDVGHYYRGDSIRAVRRRIFAGNGADCKVTMSQLSVADRFLINFGYSEDDGRRINSIIDCGLNFMPIIDDVLIGNFAPGFTNIHISEISQVGCTASWVPHPGIFWEISSLEFSIKKPLRSTTHFEILDRFGTSQFRIHIKENFVGPLKMPNLPVGVYYVVAFNGLMRETRAVWIE